MSLLPDSATFHERVQDCFVAYRGHGVSLSAVDLEILDAWAELLRLNFSFNKRF